jgi:HEAT repeat protein
MSSGTGVIGVAANFAMARLRPRAAVRRLVDALGSSDEDTSVAAYMALVKLGPRIAPHLMNAAREGDQVAVVLQILSDQGDPGVAGEVREFTESSDPRIAEAARECLAVLAEAND